MLRRETLIKSVFSSGRSKVSVSDLPASVDWRDRGVVTDPKNQVTQGQTGDNPGEPGTDWGQPW